jgi:hypothetical protein
MSEQISLEDVVAGARLLALGLRPKQIPSRDLVYADLVKRAVEDDAFRELTDAIAEGLGLIVLAVSPRTGMVLGPIEGSAFEQKLDDYARRAMPGERRDLERVVHGVAHLAIGALAFPRPDDLANETYVGRVSVEQADTVVREACMMLASRATEAEEAEDPLEDAPELERVWRVYSRRPEATLTKDGRVAPSTTRGVIGKALRFLVDQGFLVRTSDADGGTYRTTPRYQVQVRELAAERAFAELLALQVVTVTDPDGSLRTAPTSDGRTGDV